MSAEETWLPVPGYEGHYEVSDLGRVRSLWLGAGAASRPRKTPLLMKQARLRGYPAVALWLHGKTRFTYVHRMVAAAFLGPRPPGMQIAHADGSRTNNVPANLRYATPAENSQDRDRHGNTLRGEHHWRARLTTQAVRELRACWAAGRVNVSALARRFGVSRLTIRRAATGQTWRHVEAA